MAKPAPQQYDTVREAFCAVYRCRPEKFEKKVFWKGIYRHAWLPAHWMWWVERDFFADDLGAISSIGDARSEPELQRGIDDLENLALVERSIRRGTLKIRVSGTRLVRLLQPLVPLLKPLPSQSEISPPAGTTVPAAPEPARPEPAPRAEGMAITLRKLKRLHADIVAGRALELALADGGLDRDRVEAQLAEHSAGRPELAWLREYLAAQRELAQLRQENTRLQKAVAELTLRLTEANPAG